jgi:hypothetical protein
LPGSYHVLRGHVEAPCGRPNRKRTDRGLRDQRSAPDECITVRPSHVVSNSSSDVPASRIRTICWEIQWLPAIGMSPFRSLLVRSVDASAPPSAPVSPGRPAGGISQQLQAENRVLASNSGRGAGASPTRSPFGWPPRRRACVGEFSRRSEPLVSPDTLLAWHRRMIARKYDGTPWGRAGYP